MYNIKNENNCVLRSDRYRINNNRKVKNNRHDDYYVIDFFSILLTKMFKQQIT